MAKTKQSTHTKTQVTVSRLCPEKLCNQAIIVLILTTMCITTVIYPLMLPQNWLTSFRQSALGSLTGFASWMSFFNMDHSITVLKEYVFAAFLLPLVVILLLRALFWGSPSAKAMSLRERLSSPYFWFLPLLLYVALRCLPPTAGLPDWLTTPAPQSGVRNLIAMSAGLIALYALYSVRSGWMSSVRTLMTFSCVLGGLLGLISLAQHLGLTQSFLLTAADPRNRIGSLIGHNVGVSTWLMFPLSFAVYMILHRESSVWRKALCWLLVILISWVLIAAQSRSVWLLCLVLLPVYLHFQVRAAGFSRQLRMRAGLIAILVVLIVVASQTLKPSVNPLAGKHETSLRERIKRLSFRELQSETRVRITVCSMSLLAEKPLLGHGAGSFQYVYQPAQGRWLNNNRDSFVVGTWKRTDVAHDDPLQLLIELGLVGALLVLIPLVLMFRRGIRYQKTASPDEASLRRALLFPALAVMGQSFVDFPFHLPTLSIMWILSFGLWAVSPTDPPVETESAVAPPLKNSRLVSYRIAVGACLAVLCYVLYAAYSNLASQVIADRWFTMASKQFGQAQSLPDNMAEAKGKMLASARSLYRNSVHANIFYGQSYEGGALSDIETARLTENLLQENPNAKDVNLIRGSAIQMYQGALDKVKQMVTFGELNYHYAYYLRGTAEMGLYRLTNDQKHLDNARQSFTEGTMMNPADIYNLSELFRAWEMPPNANKVKAIQAKRDLFKYDARSAAGIFLDPPWQAALTGNFPAAQKTLERQLSDMPEQWRIRLMQAEVTLLEAMWPPVQSSDAQTSQGLRHSGWARERLRVADSILKEVQKQVPEGDEPIYLGRLHWYCVAGDLQAAFDVCNEGVALYPANQELASARYLIAEKLGKNPEMPFLFREQPALYQDNKDFLNAFYMDNLYEATNRITQIAKEKKHNVNPRTFVRITEYVISNGHPELARPLLEWARINDAGSAVHKRLEQLAKQFPILPEPAK